MSENLKDCEHCEFSIPRTAEVCGHCGRDVAYPVTEVDKSLKTRLYQGFIDQGGKLGLGAAVVGFLWPGGVNGAIVFGVCFFFVAIPIENYLYSQRYRSTVISGV
jgi:hypothetical protein